MSNPNRTFAYLTQHNVSVAMETNPVNADETLVTLAFAFCRDSGRRRDSFNQTVAESILTKRLASPAANGRNLRHQFVYRGTKPRVDVFYPILDAIRSNTEEKVEITLKEPTAFKTQIVIIGTIIDKTKETIQVRTENGPVIINRHDIQTMETLRTRRNVDSLQDIVRLTGKTWGVLSATPVSPGLTTGY